MRVFLSGTSFLSRYGGPARSVSRLAAALAGEGAEVGLWAPDGSAETTPFLSPDSPVRRLGGSLQDALAAFPAPGVIHDNGIWLPHNHRLAEWAGKRRIPRVVSTRGMLERWALRHRWWKKRIAWALYQRRDLAAAAGFHVTSAGEQGSVGSHGWRGPVVLIANGVDVPEMRREPTEDGNVRTALFVGRIHPVKGLPMLVDAWAGLRPAGWRMRIVGPDEGGHRREVEAAAAAAGLADDFVFSGELEGLEKSRAYEEAEVFVLPTHTENFGMAIGEALAHGLPVVTTEGAPWPGLVERECGWWVPVSAAGVAGALEQVFQQNASSLLAMGQRGRDWVEREFAWPAMARQMMDFYQTLAA